MNWVDLLILGTAALCGALGALTGFVWQAAGILSLVAGAAAALLAGPAFAEGLGRWIESREIASIAAYLGLFSLAHLAVRLLARIFEHTLAQLKLKRFDRLLGLALGAVKGIAICAVVVVVLGRCGDPERRRLVSDSALGGPVVRLADWVMGKARDGRLPEKAAEARDRLREAAEKARKLAERKNRTREKEPAAAEE